MSTSTRSVRSLADLRSLTRPGGRRSAPRGRRSVLLVLFPMLSRRPYYQNMIILSLVFAIAASGLNIITGLCRLRLPGPWRVPRPGWLHVGVMATRFDPAVAVVVDAARRGRDRRSWSRSVLGFVSLRSSGAVLRDHHRGVPVPGPGDRGQLGRSTNGTVASRLPLPTWNADYHELAVLLRAGRRSSRCSCCCPGGSGAPSSAWAWSRSARTRPRPPPSASTCRSRRSSRSSPALPRRRRRARSTATT